MAEALLNSFVPTDVPTTFCNHGREAVLIIGHDATPFCISRHFGYSARRRMFIPLKT